VKGAAIGLDLKSFDRINRRNLTYRIAPREVKNPVGPVIPVNPINGF